MVRHQWELGSCLRFGREGGEEKEGFLWEFLCIEEVGSDGEDKEMIRVVGIFC